jgi:hypothetical protein
MSKLYIIAFTTCFIKWDVDAYVFVNLTFDYVFTTKETSFLCKFNIWLSFGQILLHRTLACCHRIKNKTWFAPCFTLMYHLLLCAFYVFVVQFFSLIFPYLLYFCPSSYTLSKYSAFFSYQNNIFLVCLWITKPNSPKHSKKCISVRLTRNEDMSNIPTVI